MGRDAGNDEEIRCVLTHEVGGAGPSLTLPARMGHYLGATVSFSVGGGRVGCLWLAKPWTRSARPLPLVSRTTMKVTRPLVLRLRNSVRAGPLMLRSPWRAPWAIGKVPSLTTLSRSTAAPP